MPMALHELVMDVPGVVILRHHDEASLALHSEHCMTTWVNTHVFHARIACVFITPFVMVDFIVGCLHVLESQFGSSTGM